MANEEHPGPPMPTIDGYVYECMACDEPALPLDPPQFTPDRKRAKRGLCARHGACAPWQWELDHLGRIDLAYWKLVDANGATIMMLDENGKDYETEPPRFVRAIIALAPEMAEMLRKLEWANMTPISAMRRCPCCMGNSTISHAEGCQLMALISRLDEAGK